MYIHNGLNKLVWFTINLHFMSFAPQNLQPGVWWLLRPLPGFDVRMWVRGGTYICLIINVNNKSVIYVAVRVIWACTYMH